MRRILVLCISNFQSRKSNKKGYGNYEGSISEYVTLLTMKQCMDFSGVLVIWKIVWDSWSNINNSVISRSFFSCEH